jgi:hypothetical protein
MPRLAGKRILITGAFYARPPRHRELWLCDPDGYLVGFAAAT